VERVRAIILVLAAAFIAMPAQAENVVRWATPEPVLTWDPHGAEWAYSQMGHRQVYEALTRFDPNFRLEPALAASWKLVDPTTWRFELRQGVRFHDGAPLTVEDVVFSLERARGEGSQLKRLAGTLERVVIVGPSTFDIHTKGPDLLLPMRLRTLYIMSRLWAEAHGVTMATPHDKDQGTYARDHAMGTGAFRLVEHERDGRTVLVRNPDWWDAGQHPHQIDRVVRTRIADGAERTAALLDGEVDFVQAVSPDMVAKVRASAGLRVAETSGMRTFWLGFNQGLDELPNSGVKGRNPLRDRRVREAIYRAIDIGELIREALGGAAAPAGVIVAPGINGWSEELDRRPSYDLEGAKRLLAEAGYPDGFALRLSCGKSDEAACRNVAGQLKRTGLRVEADVRPDDAYAALLDGYDVEFYLDSFQPGTTYDAAEVFRSFFHTGGYVDGYGYTNPELDARIEAIEGELSSPIRDALIEQVWRQLAGDVVVVPLYRPLVIWASRDWLDVPINALNYPWFWRARVTSPAAR